MSLLKKVRIIATDKKEKEIIERALKDIPGNLYFNGRGRIGARLSTPYPRDTITFYPLDAKSEINHVAIRPNTQRKLNAKFESFPEGYLIVPSPDSLVSSDLFNYRIECPYKSD